MSEEPTDVRYGHDLDRVQDEAGVDLLLLKKQLQLSVEERLLNLEKQLASARELLGSARRWTSD